VGAGEVEVALLEHPEVQEVAVTGEPDPDLGERIIAWVVADAGSAALERELIAHVAGELAPHKRPRQVRFVSELPRNALGKVVKQQLREVSSA
jgi:malonyl-CoA/methylmalonyl-CoA synthetase